MRIKTRVGARWFPPEILESNRGECPTDGIAVAIEQHNVRCRVVSKSVAIEQIVTVFAYVLELFVVERDQRIVYV